jgi:hypothetical protein
MSALYSNTIIPTGGVCNVTGSTSVTGQISSGIQTAGRFTTGSNLSPLSSSNAFYIFPNAQITGNLTYSTTTGLATIGSAGWYRIDCYFAYANQFGAMVLYNYTNQTTAQNFIAGSGIANTICNGSALMYFTAGATIGVGSASYPGGSINPYSNWTISKLN